MNTTGRYACLVLGVVVRSFVLFASLVSLTALLMQLLVHVLLSFFHESYSQITSISSIKHYLEYDQSSLHHTPIEDVAANPAPINWVETDYSTITPHAPVARANATFVILARNSDLEGTIQSVRQVEERFNRRFNYPYVFLNEVEFTEEFKEYVLPLMPKPFCLLSSHARRDS